jgi:PAS domain S-box-containing protein
MEDLSDAVDAQNHMILIIDDNPANLSVVVDYLADHGFQIMVARDGEAGLRLAQQDHPDLILLDVLLPGIDGFEVCHRLKADERTREIPVIFMTIVTRTEDKIRGFEVGGMDYITKPFEHEEVLARVTTHLRLRDLTQKLKEAKESLEQQVVERTSELAQANVRLKKEIAERKQAQQNLVLVNFALNNVREAAFLIDENARFHFVNDGACDILGYTRAELLRLCVQDVDPDFPPKRWSSHWNELKAQRSLIFEGRHKAKDGRIFPVEICANYFEYDGQSYNLALARDITDRKQAEDELRQNRESTLQFSEQLAALHEVTNELSKTESSDDLCLQAVQLGRSRLGFDRVSIWFIEEHLGIMRGSFGTDERGELRDERNAQVEFRHEGLAWLLFSHKESMALVEHCPLCDHLGREVGEGDNALAALWDGGEVIGVISIDNLFTSQPISEHQLEVLRLYATALGHLITRKRAEESLRESEEKYRTLIQKIRAAVVVHGADTQILTSNSMARELLGLTEDQMMGKTATDSAWHFFLEDGTTMPLEKYPVNQVIASRQALRNLIVKVHRPNKENDVWVLVNADPVFGKEDEITQVIVTFGSLGIAVIYPYKVVAANK